jgi:hypothetical protein
MEMITYIGEYFDIRDSQWVKWYQIGIAQEVAEWLAVTYTEGIDYSWNRTLKGVWVNVTSEVYAVMILRWK